MMFEKQLAPFGFPWSISINFSENLIDQIHISKSLNNNVLQAEIKSSFIFVKNINNNCFIRDKDLGNIYFKNI